MTSLGEWARVPTKCDAAARAIEMAVVDFMIGEVVDENERMGKREYGRTYARKYEQVLRSTEL